IANPGYSTNTVTITLHRPDGSSAGTPVKMTLAVRHQVARFFNDIFPDSIPTASPGSIHIEGVAPLSLLALRFSGATFSTISLTNSRMALHGAALVFPQIAIDGGGAS